MTFLEELQSHKGGLLHIKSELYWYGRRGPDRTPDRVCLLLDAAALEALNTPAAKAANADTFVRATPRAAALLLIDGCPQWVWVGQEDVEIL